MAADVVISSIKEEQYVCSLKADGEEGGEGLSDKQLHKNIKGEKTAMFAASRKSNGGHRESPK